MNIESAQLKERLANHEFFDWFAGDAAPADDLDVVLVVGPFGRDAIAKQRRLFFIQTASAGYDGVDIDAATEWHRSEIMI